MATTRLLLVDAMGVFYRAFFAIRSMSAPDGSPTNGVFGFIRMVEQMRRHWRPTHMAVVFEGGIPAHRMALVPEYKANRPPMPDEMREQIPLLHEYLEGSGIAELRLDGWEADDVLAAMACQARPEIEDVLLATSDKDLMQVIGDGISMVTVSGEMSRIGPAEVEAKTGVNPTCIVDWLAMVGDSADNIPGVHGVGPKTASRLLAEFGTLTAVYDRLEEVSSEALRGKLEAGREVARRNCDMVRLHTDLGELPEVDVLATGPVQTRALLAMYDRLGFKGLANGLRAPELF
jgi:DNA polymerase-1